ncbi:MAG: ArsI/CadI family heavy metal resistance metalloenzyme [Betaproteobacteria bacterium]|jgi:catechol 2,3-dioxygenase-like lactoylglutathione lyase family enzyme|nr:VOC family protein [Rhodocyclaceae bacterium]MCA3134276.1 VOC family protein [Rhodocyclaceae bacterium]MCA3142127.1 VOC family protein [Rhodocyclaceae bacterium]MCA3146816.1 VOC family protein [Rhodocyclaceae bacterium]MCE2898346.1 VOC family protein [Betaproteobacteria bacterium]
MKRFHVHVSVDDLAANIRFYSTVFGCAPTVQHPDYAKWMLDDPRVNFALSSRGAPPGLDHMGIQVDSEDELAALRTQADSAQIAAIDQQAAACCYARSDKYWITDPQGIAWETFHTLDAIPTYGEARREAAPAPAAAPAPSCCAPAVQPVRITRAVKAPVIPVMPAACCAPDSAEPTP